MAYNPSKDVTAGYISPLHQHLLQALLQAHKRTKRAELEQAVEQAFINEFGYEQYAVYKDTTETN